MRLHVPALLSALAASVLAIPTPAQNPTPPPRVQVPTPGSPMLATDQFLFVLRGDTLYQFDVRSLALLHTFSFDDRARGPAAAAAAPAQRREVPPAPPAPPADLGPVLDRALTWLAAHQDEDGRWDADHFEKHDANGEPCTGPGRAVHDVGATGLCMLAMLAQGSTLKVGPHRDSLRRAARWLCDQQQENGLFGLNASQDFVYDHAIAAFAMCEAYGLSDHAPLRRPAQRGLDYLELHRNPYGVWRYQPKDNDNDTSVTTWALFALASGKSHGLEVPDPALKAIGVWYDAVTDDDGRAGYTKRGEGSSRPVGRTANFPADRGEAMTAAAMIGRFLLGQGPEQRPILRASAARLLEKPPEWRPECIDSYYWYLGTLAMYQMGGEAWEVWSRSLSAIANAQRKDGNCAGSWDPVGVWDEDGGRIYATALNTLTLQLVARAARVRK